MRKSTTILVAVFLGFLNIFCWREVFALAGPRYLLVDFLNVGQGDAIFAKTPQGHQILIDGGPSSSVLGKLSSLIPFWDKTIDLVVLTHPESDHLQGLLDVFKRYKADYILWTGVVRNTPEYNAWIKALQKQEKKGAKIIIAKANQKLKAGNVLIENIYPLESLEGQMPRNTSNDTSAVLKIIFGENTFLFTGDIGFKAEEEMIGSGQDLSSDVLKIAHHGSKYSTSDLFLESAKPEFAVIGVGKNSYGQPTAEVLQKLEKFVIKVLRTDKDGDIKFASDGRKITPSSNF